MGSLTLPCDSRWRALLTSCVVVARCGLDANDACFRLRLAEGLERMDAASAHAVLSALALPMQMRQKPRPHVFLVQ
jgi:hypothetical protein